MVVVKIRYLWLALHAKQRRRTLSTFSPSTLGLPGAISSKSIHSASPTIRNWRLSCWGVRAAITHSRSLSFIGQACFTRRTLSSTSVVFPPRPPPHRSWVSSCRCETPPYNTPTRYHSLPRTMATPGASGIPAGSDSQPTGEFPNIPEPRPPLALRRAPLPCD